MPFYEYEAKDMKKSCARCAEGFVQTQKISDPALTTCPDCGAPLIKIISSISVGSSKSGLDDRAKSAGFHKLQKLGKGEYEKKY